MTTGARDVHLVGSVCLSDAEEVFRTLAGILGERAPRLPDGETGAARSLWIQCQIPFFLGHPLLEMVEPDPAREGSYRPALVPAGGLYSTTMADRYRGRARLREGASAEDLSFEDLGYARWASESYETFARLKDEGVIPARTRFQVCLPSPPVVTGSTTLAEEIPKVLPAYEAGLAREIEQMARTIPHDELAIQWDSVDPFRWEVSEPGAHAAILADLVRLAGYVPEGVELGYHLCYGDFEHKHGREPEDLGTCVNLANVLAARVDREIAWVHMPVPRDRADTPYFEPLRDLDLHPETTLVLGLVHLTDGVEGTLRRIEAATAVRPDFAIATECGFGRRPPETIPELVRIHLEAAGAAGASVSS